MGFANPVGATKPFYRFREEFYWPCTAGEQLAPTLAGSAAYSQYLSKPTVFVPGASGSATWPNVPRISPINPAQQSLTISFLLGATAIGGAGQIAFMYGNFKPSFALRIETFTGDPKRYFANATDAAGNAESIDTGIIPSITSFDAITIVYAVTGVATLTINGAVTATTKLWLPNDISDAILFKLFATVGGAHITQIRFTYA